MRDALRRFDGLLARGEASIAAAILLGMIVAASVQAVLRNLTSAGASWANPLLAAVDWIDPFLQTGTMWVAFLGASLAAHADRHIAVDVAARFAPPRARMILRVISFVAAGIICLVLSRVFLDAVLVLGAARTLDYEVLGADGGAQHVCDAAASLVADSGLARPTAFCALRGFLRGLGLTVETVTPAFYLVAPFGFVVIGLRFLLRAGALGIDLARGDIDEGAPPTPGELER